MEDMNDILNPPTEDKETASTGETSASIDAKVVDEQEQAAGETTQVAAETDAEPDSAKVKAELSALTKERERLRQKEAALDEEKARLSSASTETTRSSNQETGTETKNPQTELKELRQQYRTALKDSLLDPDDEDAAKLVDDIEDRMEELRLSVVDQKQRAMSDREKADSEFGAAYKSVHDDFPFLSPDHPKANAELNENINSFMSGRIHMGDSRAVALKKAVNLFAPEYAKSLESGTAGDDETSERAAKKAEADKRIAEKLSKGGFSEVRSVGRTQGKAFSGPTPMSAILGKA
jgi:hypothetical protein